MPSEVERIAELARWRTEWWALAAKVRRRAEERAIRWVERHIKAQRFEDQTPWQYPLRKQVKYRRREDLYADRLARADTHAAKGDRCSDQIARIKAQAKAREPKQTSLFV